MMGVRFLEVVNRTRPGRHSDRAKARLACRLDVKLRVADYEHVFPIDCVFRSVLRSFMGNYQKLRAVLSVRPKSAKQKIVVQSRGLQFDSCPAFQVAGAQAKRYVVSAFNLI